MTDQKLIDGKVEVRPFEKGGFDELVMYDEHGRCIVHAEMMDYDGPLWIGFYPPSELSKPADEQRHVVMWINAKDGKLEITAIED